MFGHRAFAVAGPAACNSLPDYQRDPSRVPLTVFAATRKLFFSRSTGVHSALEAFASMCCIDLLLTLAVAFAAERPPCRHAGDIDAQRQPVGARRQSASSDALSADVRGWTLTGWWYSMRVVFARWPALLGYRR